MAFGLLFLTRKLGLSINQRKPGSLVNYQLWALLIQGREWCQYRDSFMYGTVSSMVLAARGKSAYTILFSCAKDSPEPMMGWQIRMLKSGTGNLFGKQYKQEDRMAMVLSLFLYRSSQLCGTIVLLAAMMWASFWVHRKGAPSYFMPFATHTSNMPPCTDIPLIRVILQHTPSCTSGTALCTVGLGVPKFHWFGCLLAAPPALLGPDCNFSDAPHMNANTVFFT